MAGSLKFDLDHLSRWLVHGNLISTVFIDVWFTETSSRLSRSISGSHLTWSQPPWLMVGSLKFDLDSLGRCLVHWNLISAVLVDGWYTVNLISTTLVDGWFTEIWLRPSWSMPGSLISTLVDDWFTKIWSRPSWSMAGSLKLDLNHLCRWLVYT